MKKLVYSSKQCTPAVIEINIDVYFDVYEIIDIVAPKIRPVLKPSGEMDDDAWQDHDLFILNVYGLLGPYRFEEIEFEPSNKSNTSWYAWFYVKNKNGSVNTDVIVRLRISDHANHTRFKGTLSPEMQKHRKSVERGETKYIQDFANLHKRPVDKEGDQKYYMAEIVVNSETFGDYDDAYLAADKLIDRIYEKYSK